MDEDSPLYAKRVAGGLYDSIVSQLMDLPKGVSLGDATYQSDFVRDINAHTGNFSYKYIESHGRAEYETVLVGEILPHWCGNEIFCNGQPLFRTFV